MSDKTQPVNPKAKTAKLAATEPFKPGSLQEILKARAAAGKTPLPEVKSDDAEGETQPMTPTPSVAEESPTALAPAATEDLPTAQDDPATRL
jgi:hypothetical protein